MLELPSFITLKPRLKLKIPLHLHLTVAKRLMVKFANSNCTHGHPLKLYYSDSRINARAHSFSVRIVLLWNRLPAPTVLLQYIAYRVLEAS